MLEEGSINAKTSSKNPTVVEHAPPSLWKVRINWYINHKPSWHLPSISVRWQHCKLPQQNRQGLQQVDASSSQKSQHSLDETLAWEWHNIDMIKICLWLPLLNLNMRDLMGQTAFHRALSKCKHQMAELLLTWSGYLEKNTNTVMGRRRWYYVLLQ